MVKILSQSGTSLADIYNVEGSIAGVEQLLSGEVSVVHEMGQLIASERMGGQLLRVAIAGIVASADFAAVLTGINTGVSRFHGVTIITDNASRLERVNVNVRTQPGGRPTQTVQEHVVWAFDGTNSENIEIVDDGGVQITIAALRGTQEFNNLPCLLTGADQPQLVSEIAIRGTATAFGAGTVDVILIAHVSFGQAEGLGSRGLPIPSW